MFNILAADILSFIQPGFLAEVMTGTAGEIQITFEFLLVAAVMLEIPIAMIFLSRVLPQRPARLANLGAVATTAAFVIFGGSASLHYAFFVTMEVLAMLLIVRYAWTWSAEPSERGQRAFHHPESAEDSLPAKA